MRHVHYLFVLAAACASRTQPGPPAAPRVQPVQQPTLPAATLAAPPPSVAIEPAELLPAIEPQGEDVALIMVPGKTSCMWSLFDPLSRRSKTVLETEECPETAAFDPAHEVTYFLLDDNVYRATWSQKRATKIASIRTDLGRPNLLIAAETGQVRVGIVSELKDSFVENGKTFYRFDGNAYPAPEFSGVPVIVQMYDLDETNQWKRRSITPSLHRPDLDVYEKVDAAQPRAGTFTLWQLHVSGDCELKKPSCSMRTLEHDEPRDAALFKPFANSVWGGVEEPTVAMIAIDQTHQLLAATFAFDAVSVGSPLFYCTSVDCAKRVRLSDQPDRKALDWRTWPEHTPLYVGVRAGLALVGHMRGSGTVAIYSTRSAKPMVQFKSAVAAWAPLRAYWNAQP